jgi:hypothetical protein
MSALTLLIIRHAEKPGESWPGPGLTVDGVPDKKSLSAIINASAAAAGASTRGAAANTTPGPDPGKKASRNEGTFPAGIYAPDRKLLTVWRMDWSLALSSFGSR